LSTDEIPCVSYLRNVLRYLFMKTSGHTVMMSDVYKQTHSKHIHFRYDMAEH
jgi:hypothetical protein